MINPLHVNINKIFIKNAYFFFPKKTAYRKCPCCTFLQISVIFGFMESGILYLLPLNLFQYDAFIEVYEKNSASHREVVGGGEIFYINN